MTIDAQQKTRDLLALCLNHGARMFGVVALWFLAIIVLTVSLPPKYVPAVMALGSEQRIMAKIPETVQFMRSKPHYVILTSKQQNYVFDIYRAGSWLVLPALRNGCFDMTS